MHTDLSPPIARHRAVRLGQVLGCSLDVVEFNVYTRRIQRRIHAVKIEIKCTLVSLSVCCAERCCDTGHKGLMPGVTILKLVIRQ